MKTKFKIVNAKLEKLTNNKRKNLNLQKSNTWIYIIICIFFIRTILTPYTNLLKIAYDSIQITYIFAIIVLTKKTANIEEKQFQLLTNKKSQCYNKTQC